MLVGLSTARNFRTSRWAEKARIASEGAVFADRQTVSSGYRGESGAVQLGYRRRCHDDDGGMLEWEFNERSMCSSDG
jgi:hypothetical protein